jgi:hypothetical protein
VELLDPFYKNHGRIVVFAGLKFLADIVDEAVKIKNYCPKKELGTFFTFDLDKQTRCLRL